MALAGAADIAVVKVAPLGGVWAALRIATAAACRSVVSSAVDTSVGLAAGLALAAALPELPYACGLGTASLLSADVVAAGLTPVGGSSTCPLLRRNPTGTAGWPRRDEEDVLAGPPAPRRRAALKNGTLDPVTDVARSGMLEP